MSGFVKHDTQSETTFVIIGLETIVLRIYRRLAFWTTDTGHGVENWAGFGIPGLVRWEFGLSLTLRWHHIRICKTRDSLLTIMTRAVKSQEIRGAEWPGPEEVQTSSVDERNSLSLQCTQQFSWSGPTSIAGTLEINYIILNWSQRKSPSFFPRFNLNAVSGIRRQLMQITRHSFNFQKFWLLHRMVAQSLLFPDERPDSTPSPITTAKQDLSVHGRNCKTGLQNVW